MVQIIMTLIVIGILLWLIDNYIPMQSTIKNILNAVIVIATVLWLLHKFGIIPWERINEVLK